MFSSPRSVTVQQILRGKSCTRVEANIERHNMYDTFGSNDGNFRVVGCAATLNSVRVARYASTPILEQSPKGELGGKEW